MKSGRDRVLTRRLVHPWVVSLLALLVLCPSQSSAQESLTDAQWQAIEAAQQARINAVNLVYGSVVAIYNEARQGGGSGVIIDSSGLALTNHHVIMGAGRTGVAGLADGRLYPWRLVGTDPGGDLAVIQLEGRDDFPTSAWGDSDRVHVGDFVMAMGNPFLLAEDHRPTVTLGIVSGIERYQYGSGKNQLIYGNCIQVDSSINPGNSGGPLFNLQGEVLGINGRGSFAARGRVNVGLGYAISINQVRNFYPDLLATKLVEHGTLDAQFGVRGDKVVCETLNLDSPVAQAGLELGDELLSFQGQPVTSANQFTNSISTMPETWPVRLEVAKSDGSREVIWTRLLGLPYTPPPQPQIPDDMPEEQKEQMQKQLALVEFLRQPPGQPTDQAENERLASRYWDECRASLQPWFGSLPVESSQTVLEVDIPEDSDTQLRWQLEANHDFVVSRISQESQRTWSRVEGAYELTTTDAANEQTESLSKAAARRSAEVVAGDVLQRLRHGLEADDKLTLEGGDLSDGHICCRLKVTEADGDWWFLWVRAFDSPDAPRGYPVKASLDQDAMPFAIQWLPTADDASVSLALTHGLGEEILERWNPQPSDTPAASPSE